MAVAKLSVYSNTALVILKVVVGLMMGSVAVISEAIHSGIDLLAALIARYSVKRSAEPADKDHMYGHGKYENLSGVIEGALIFVAAAGIIYEALNKLFEPEPEPIGIISGGLIVMGVSAVLNLLVSRRLAKVAKKTDSLALEADAYHLTTDVWTSVGVFIALALIWATDFQWLDPLVALVVAALIIHAAYDITTRSAHGLLDRSLPETEIKLIERIIKDRQTEVLNFHRLRARKMGSERQIDLHVVVPRNLSVKEGHDLVSNLEKEIKKELPNCVIVVHIEPCDANCQRCKMTPEPATSLDRPNGSSECRPKD